MQPGFLPIHHGSMPHPPSSRELRKGRASLPGQRYLVTAVTYARSAWFADFGVACVAARTLG